MRTKLLAESCVGHGRGAQPESEWEPDEHQDFQIYRCVWPVLALQDAPTPAVLPYEPPHVVRAREAVRKPPKEVQEFGDLLVSNFASGKSSAVKVACLHRLTFHTTT